MSFRETEIKWPELSAEINSLPIKTEKNGISEKWIFRGHNKASWSLETTLERYFLNQGQPYPADYLYKDYVAKLNELVPLINKRARKNFEHFTYKDIKARNEAYGEYLKFSAYIRHLGFPSALLDWSENWRVAAYFAYIDASPNDKVAIYAYKDFEGEGGSWRGLPNIVYYDPEQKESERHIRQQACYTACLQCPTELNTEILARHENGLRENPGNHEVIKYILDGSEKGAALQELEEKGITAQYLFPDSLDAFVKDLVHKNLP